MVMNLKTRPRGLNSSQPVSTCSYGKENLIFRSPIITKSHNRRQSVLSKKSNLIHIARAKTYEC